MNKLIHLMMAMTALTASTWTFAGAGSSCHFHGSKQAEQSIIEQCANQRRDLYLKNGTIEGSWKGISPGVVEVVNGEKGQEWRVRFDNPNVTDKSKNKLFMFFTLPGNFVAANYSGK